MEDSGSMRLNMNSCRTAEIYTGMGNNLIIVADNHLISLLLSQWSILDERDIQSP